jgi:hypothetical protein
MNSMSLTFPHHGRLVIVIVPCRRHLRQASKLTWRRANNRILATVVSSDPLLFTRARGRKILTIKVNFLWVRRVLFFFISFITRTLNPQIISYRENWVVWQNWRTGLPVGRERERESRRECASESLIACLWREKESTRDERTCKYKLNKNKANPTQELSLYSNRRSKRRFFLYKWF